MTRTPPKAPLVAIIGATGTGKSQLAVDLARRFDGEIINGDAMQLYEGLPIITNKITPDEQNGVPHHLLGCIGLHEQTWVVGTFVQRATKVIEETRERGKLPILVGGTHYYTQSLLFHDRLIDSWNQDGSPKAPLDDPPRQETQAWPILEEPTEVLLEELRRVDPVMAERWHPNDRRKIRHSLEIYVKTGRKASEVYAEQQMRKNTSIDEVPTAGHGDQSMDGPFMRLPTLLFWVHAEMEVLRQRLDERVEKMLAAGLLNEVRLLSDYANAQAEAGRPVDASRGIWVSIGYKEFTDYIAALENSQADEKELAKLKQESLEKTKAATRQYAKRQVRWIRIKLINTLINAGAGDKMYLLDGSDVSAFDSSVVKPAFDITQRFLLGVDMPDPSSVSSEAAEMLKPRRDYDLSAVPEKWAKKHCEVCNVTCVVEQQWEQHTKSKAHQKLVSKKRKQVELVQLIDSKLRDGESAAVYENQASSG